MGHAQFDRCLAPLVVMLLLYRHAAGDSIWCVASPRATEVALQDGLNYACGQGGVDCSPVKPGGSCFEPDTLHNHASYAYNSYFQVDVDGTARCDFGGSAMLTTNDPSTPTCKYPSTRDAATSDHTSQTWGDA